MLYQLALDNFHLAKPLFAPETRLAVTAALAGESPAELYVDDPATPQAATLHPLEPAHLSGWLTTQ